MEPLVTAWPFGSVEGLRRRGNETKEITASPQNLRLFITSIKEVRIERKKIRTGIVVSLLDFQGYI